MQSKLRRFWYVILSIVFVIFSIPLNLFEDFLPKINVLATNQYSSYKEAYRDLLINTYGLNTSNVRFDLINIDGGDPELVVSEDSSHYKGVKVYSYSNNQLNRYFNNYGTDEFGSFGSMHFVEGSGYIVSDYSGMGEETMDIYKVDGTNAKHEHTFTIEFSTNHQMEYFGLDEIPNLHDSQYYIYYDGSNYGDNGFLEQNIISYEDFKSKLSKYNINDATINSSDSYPSSGYDSTTNLSVVIYDYMLPLNQNTLDDFLHVDTTTSVKSNDLFSEVISQYQDDESATYSLVDYTFDGNLDLIILHGESESKKYYELYIAVAESYSYIGQISAMHTTLYFDKYSLYTTATYGGESPNQLIMQYYVDNLTGEVLMNRDIPKSFYDKYGYYDLNNTHYKVNFKDVSQYTFKEVKATNPVGGMTLDEYLELLFNSSMVTTTTDITTISESTHQTFTNDTHINDIINTIINNKSLWFDDSFENDAKVTFLDIDFDGELEFIIADNQGSGYYTYAYYYKVTQNSIKKIPVSDNGSNDYTILPDILGDNSIQLYSIDNILKYTATDIEKYNTSENNEKQIEFYFDSSSKSIYFNMCYMMEKLNSNTLYFDSAFKKIDKSSYDSLKKDFSSTHKDANNLNLKYKWVSIENDTSKFGKNLLDAYNTFHYNNDKTIPITEENTHIDDDTYNQYFIEAHLNDQRKNNDLYYDTYINSNNALQQANQLLNCDYLYGSLYSVTSVEKMEDLLSLDLSQIDDNPFETKTYYGQFLAQLVANSYNESTMTQGVSEYLIETINQMVSETDEETVWNALKSSNELNELSNSFDALDALEGLSKILNEIETAETLKEVNKFFKPISEAVTLIGFAIDGINLTVDYLDNIESYIKYTASYKALLKCTDEVKETFKLMSQNTNDENLKNILNEYIGILNANSPDDYIKNLIRNYEEDEAINIILDIGSKFVSIILNAMVMETPYLNVAFVAYKFVVSIEKSELEKLVDSQNLIVNVSNIMACNEIHNTLYRCYSQAYENLNNSKTLLNAKIVHTINQYYKLVDMIAIQYYQEYVSRFIDNNIYLSVGDSKVCSPWFNGIMLNELSKIFNEEGILSNPSKIYENTEIILKKLINLNSDLEELKGYYINYSCCKSNEELAEYINTCKYYLSLGEDAINSTLEDVANWIENEKNKTIDFFSNLFDFIIVSCPVSVEVYDSENNLIAVLSDDSSEIKYGYEKYFMTIHETLDEVSNNKTYNDYSFESTKAKIIVLPHDSKEYTIKVIATDNGTMDINCYTIDSINDVDWFNNTSKLNYNFQDIPLKQSDTFELNQNDNGYILNNNTTGETYTNKSLSESSTNTVLHSKKIVIIVIIAVAIVMIVIIIILIIKSNSEKKKKKHHSHEDNQNVEDDLYF